LTTYTVGTQILVEYNGVYQSNTVSYDEETQVVTMNGDDGQGTFTNLDRIVFSSNNLAVNRSDIAFDVYRLYEAAFNRTPDIGGLSFWIRAADNGVIDLFGMAEEFRGSEEFMTNYGSNPTNEELVDIFYNNILDRDGEAEGVEFWLTALNNGLSDAQLLVDFSNSVENIINVESVINDGVLFFI